MHPTRARALLVPLAAAALLLGGCSGGTDDESAAVAERPDKAESPEGQPADDVSASAACLEGEWGADTAAQIESTKAALLAGGFDAEVTASGDSVTAFADGRVTTTYTNQVTEATWTMEGQELRSVTSMDGVTTGTYAATATEIHITDVDASGLDLQVTNSINGEPQDDTVDSARAMVAGMELEATVGCT